MRISIRPCWSIFVSGYFWARLFVFRAFKNFFNSNYISQESVTTLLTDEEMQQLIENFDKLDKNQGNDMLMLRYLQLRF